MSASTTDPVSSPVNFRRVALAAALIFLSLTTPMALHLLGMLLQKLGLFSYAFYNHPLTILIPQTLCQLLIIPAILLFASARPLSLSGRFSTILCIIAATLLLTLGFITGFILLRQPQDTSAYATLSSYLNSSFFLELTFAFEHLLSLFLFSAAALHLFRLGTAARARLFALLASTALALCALPIAFFFLNDLYHLFSALHGLSFLAFLNGPILMPLLVAHSLFELLTWLSISLAALYLARHPRPLHSPFPLT